MHKRKSIVPFSLRGLGQAGFRLELGRAVLFIDPYLSNRVEQLEGPSMRRLRAAPIQAADINDANYVLISHAHADHCDIDTLLPIAAASPSCRFIGPKIVVDYLVESGIDRLRVIVANCDSLELKDGIHIIPIAAAHRHIEEDFDGFLRYLGYVIRWQDRCILHTGDTSVHPGLIERLKMLGPIDVALLPVNECNYFRDRAGIVGNMSIREAFKLAEEIDAKVVVPMHYDMFKPNQAYREEIEVIYRKQAPAFKLELDPEKIGAC